MRRPVTARFAASLLAVMLAGCGADAPPPSATSATRPAAGAGMATAPDARILGVAGGIELAAEPIERAIAIALFDNAISRHRLLREALEMAALAELDGLEPASRSALLDLAPPAAPRVPLAIDLRRLRGAQAAPVTLMSVCNFESPLCARLQQVIDALQPLYPGLLRLAERHLALPFHRNADSAAAVGFCAAEQDRYWPLHDALRAGTGALDDARLDAAIRTAQLDAALLDDCLAAERAAEAVERDNREAIQQGIHQVPTLFVNGLYAGPDPEPGQVLYLIEQELDRLGLASPRAALAGPASTAPLLVEAVLASQHAGQGMAILAPLLTPDDTLVVREGGQLGHAITLSQVSPAGITILRNGQAEFLALNPPAASPPSADLAAAETQAIVRPHRAVPVTLDRDDVIVRLSDRAGLAEVLQTVPMMAGGYRQLRISEIRPGSLYELMGLEPGDVILGVNEQPLHEADNPLWDAMERAAEVRIRVMRSGGLAHHYTYRFDD